MPRSSKNVYRKCQHSFFEDIRRQQADKEEKIDQEETEDDEEDEEDWTCCGQFKSQSKNNSAIDDPFFTMPIDKKLKLIADEAKQTELSYKSKIETRDSEIKMLEKQLDEVLKRNSELEKELSTLKIAKMKDQKMLDMFDQFTNDWIETKGLSLHCKICSEMYNTNDHFQAALKCGHTFGEFCIRKVLENTKRCPVCNKNAQFSDISRVY